MGDITETNLLGMIKEYLEFEEFEETVRRFEKECKLKGKLIPKPQDSSLRDLKICNIQKALINAFDDGDHKVFFQLWTDNIPFEVIDRDAETQSLEFNLYIHFTIYPLRTHPAKHGQAEFAERVSIFKQYLETRGAVVNHNTHLLPYCALSFVPNPLHNPSFKDLFQDSWILQLREKLEQFLSVSRKLFDTPRLLNLFKDRGRSTTGESEHCNTAMYNKMQADYCNLIEITAELVDSLEATISGKMVSPEYIQSMCVRLLSNQLRQNTDFTRPGTGYYSMSPYDDGYASSFLRASIASQRSREVPMLPSLDYEKLKKDLIAGQDRLRALLLQALRWRLTRSLPGEQRDTTLQAYISNDLLECHSTKKKTVLHLIRSKNDIIRHNMARLISAFASLREGRAYLSQNPMLLKLMTDTLKAEETDSLTRENVLVAMYKLSLRRSQQTAMIAGDLIGWLVDELQDPDSLNDNTLVYATALFMNLCQRTKGQKKCAENAKHVLKVLTDLLGHENYQIWPYVNGALYNILHIPSVRHDAKEMSVEDILNCYNKDANPQHNTQINSIIKRLNSDSVEGPESDHEVEEEGNDEEFMDTDIDIDEILQPDPTERSGENLLTTDYLGIMTNMPKVKKKSPPLPQPSADETLQRPFMPSSHHGYFTMNSQSGSQQGEDNGSGDSRQNSQPPTRCGSHLRTEHVGSPDPDWIYRSGEGNGDRGDPLNRLKSKTDSRQNSQPPTHRGSRPKSEHSGSPDPDRIYRSSESNRDRGDVPNRLKSRTDSGQNSWPPKHRGSRPKSEHSDSPDPDSVDETFASHSRVPRTPVTSGNQNRAHQDYGPSPSPEQSSQSGSASSTEGGQWLSRSSKSDE